MSDEQSRAFDPAKHLSKVSGRDYLEVKWRLVWFHEHHPNGSIVTEMVWHQNNAAIFRASVSWASEDGIATRTGWGSESSDDFGDYLEKAETKAIGRALAAAGFGTQFCDDHAFGADKQRVVDSPVDIRSQRPQNAPQARQRPDNRRYAALADASPEAPQNRPQDATGEAEPATQNQIKAIFAIGRKLDIDVKPWVAAQFGGRSVDDLAKFEASLIIEDWQAKVDKGSPVGAPA